MKGKEIGIPNEVIMSRIYYVRNQKIMLDSDLALLYNVETRRLNEQVKRNIERFPKDFMFQLNSKEFDILMSQFATSKLKEEKRGGTRKLPYAFTELGVAMLSSVLNSPKAIKVNIKIMRVFTQIRRMVLDNTEVRLAIEEIRKKTDNNSKNIEVVFKYLDELIEKKENKIPIEKIGYKV